MRRFCMILLSVSIISCLLMGCGKDKDKANDKAAENAPAAEETEEQEPVTTEDTVSEEEQTSYAEYLLDDLTDMAVEQAEAEKELGEMLEEAAAEAEASAITFNFPDNVIYDEDGVTITLDSLNTLRAEITVRNNQTSNEKLSFNLINMAFNGITESVDNIGKTERANYSIFDMAAGEEESFEIEFTDITELNKDKTLYEIMQDTYKDLGAENMDLLTVAFDYEITIGADNEHLRSVVYTDKYSSDADLLKYFGELKTSVKEEDLSRAFMVDNLGSFDVYVNTDLADSNKYSVIYVGTYDSKLDDHRLDGSCILINGKELPASRSPQIRGRGMIDVLTYEIDPSEIRKENSISNDESIEVSCYLYTSMADDLKKITVPVTTLPPQ